ncbi:ribosomal protein L23 (nucleomorph) [Bigelowiella natans]|uniref:Ribosomal protein L23 n=1 Tax=Bigelowiella natans TaxID=227086 RepID=Q3LW55_BIGNA|nr:ribosomal protein L23 [Bigelowiella natans]ABA27310.1 ribosomal protein L23 [Bigelowiella natans]
MIITRRIRKKFSKSKFKISLGIFIKSCVKCSDNSGAKLLSIIGVFKSGSRLNRIPGASPGSMILGSVKKGKIKLRKTILSAIIIRQKKSWRRKDGSHVCFEDNACVIVNLKGELKGSSITGPVAKECAQVWPRISNAAHSIM